MRSSEVRRVLREGKPSYGERVVVFLAPGTGRTAFVAGRKVGGAVQRNRARRIMRTAWSEVAPKVGDTHDVALVARAAIQGARTQDLVAEMTRSILEGKIRP